MKRTGRRILCMIMVLLISLANTLTVFATPQEISAASSILMEASTGQIIYENNADERRSPASITKIMTLLLIFEQLEKGSVKRDDEVTTSAYAKSMGGSQVFLEEGEIQTVDTLIKCIAVASGNDASVAMAEKIAGSETEFVAMMNQKATDLGLTNTHFVDCCGLSDSDEHYTSARDVAVMSKELITKYPQVYEYTKIWMEDITHVTNKGSSIFTLSSTNKLLKQYEYATGLKTGSTNKAKYCLSATANHNGIDMIAVIMGATDYEVRFADAKQLLEYGYSVSHLYQDENTDVLPPLPVKGAVTEAVEIVYEGPFRYLDINGNELSGVEKKLELPQLVEAPIAKNDSVGQATYYLDGKKLGSVNLLFAQDVPKAGIKDYFSLVLHKMLL